jgi:5-methylcytosine-specific restriction endonuclease McrA
MMPIIIGDQTFKTQKQLKEYIQSIFKELDLTESIKDKNIKYFEFLKLLCERHPQKDEKLKNFKDFKINRDSLNKKAFSLFIINNDNTETIISWIVCISGKDINPLTLFSSCLRNEIFYQINDFKETVDLSICTLCTKLTTEIHIDHIIHFSKLVDDFISINKIKIPNNYLKPLNSFILKFNSEDQWIGDLFKEYHLNNASLRVLCAKCNLTRTKYIK